MSGPRQWSNQVYGHLLPGGGDWCGVQVSRGFVLRHLVRQAIRAMPYVLGNFSIHSRPVVESGDAGDGLCHAEVIGGRIVVQSLQYV